MSFTNALFIVFIEFLFTDITVDDLQETNVIWQTDILYSKLLADLKQHGSTLI